MIVSNHPAGQTAPANAKDEGMKDDYVIVKHVDNGFQVQLNEYGDKGRRGAYVARNEEELYQLIRELFPPRSDEPDERNAQ